MRAQIDATGQVKISARQTYLGHNRTKGKFSQDNGYVINRGLFKRAYIVMSQKIYCATSIYALKPLLPATIRLVYWRGIFCMCYTTPLGVWFWKILTGSLDEEFYIF